MMSNINLVSFTLFSMLIIVVAFQLYLFNRYSFFPRREQIPVSSSTNSRLIQSTEFSPALIIPSTIQNILYTNIHILMWGGTVVIPVALQQSERAIFRQYVDYALLPSRVQLIEYEVDSPSFPVNSLRNTAIRSCQSTHIIVISSFHIPSCLFFHLF